MKTSSGQESPDAAGRQKAQACLATNLVMPGLGSLVGGHKLGGLIQLGLGLAGFALTLICGTQFIYWMLAHWSEYHDVNATMDPLKPLRDLWIHARWSLLGMALFACSWLWALITSRAFLRRTKDQSGVGSDIN